jgi:hypothetical protein
MSFAIYRINGLQSVRESRISALSRYFSKKGTKFEEEPTASISYPEDEDSRLFQNVGAQVLK